MFGLGPRFEQMGSRERGFFNNNDAKFERIILISRKNYLLLVGC